MNKYLQRLFQDYRGIILFTTGLTSGLVLSIFLWEIIIAVFSFIFGYGFNKAIMLRKKEAQE